MSDETETQEAEPVSSADDPVKKLSAKVDEILGEKKKLTARLREYEAAEAERKAEIAKREEEEARKKGEWEKVEKGWQEKLQAIEGDAKSWRSKYFDRELDLGMARAVDEVSVKPEFKKAVSVLLRQQAEIDEDGSITIEGKPIAEYVRAWAKTDEGKAFVISGAVGSGANGGGKATGQITGDNPWAPGKVSLARQAEIYRADPQTARQMAAQHGYRLA
jgi:hypothetical protein